MNKDVELANSDKSIEIFIDREKHTLNVKKIVKLPTNIALNESIDTALYEDIEIDACLCSTITTHNEDTIDNNGIIQQATHINTNNIIDTYGTVLIHITDTNNTTIYYTKTIDISHGLIEHTIPNNLPLGTYNLTIKYLGNRFYEESTLQTSFQISKRLLNCTLTQNKYFVNPGQTLNIEGVLTDAITGKYISDCPINYVFNEESNEIYSHAGGAVNILLIIPEADKEHCVDGKPVTYQLYLYLDNQTYKLQDMFIPIIVNKIETETVIRPFELDENNNVSFQVSGYVKTNTHTPYAKYGQVYIEFPDIKLNNEMFVSEDIDINEEDGHFCQEFDVAELETNMKNENVLNLYDATSQKINTYIKLDVIGDEDNNKIIVNKGDYITVEAIVTSGNDNRVIDGMISFTLKREDKKLYRYVDELNDEGVAIFKFLTSRTGEYDVEVDYYDGVLSYKDSTKSIDKKIEVI